MCLINRLMKSIAGSVSSTSISEVCIIKMRDIAPNPIIAVATFENQTVNVRIPFEISAKSMENHDISWSEVHGFIDFKEHM